MISIKNISIRYGDITPVDRFSMEVLRGEKVVMTGASGRGKSSILNAIAGFVMAEKGSITVDGAELSASTIGVVRQKLSFLPQETNIDLQTVRDLLFYPVSFRHNSHLRPTDEQVVDLMERLGVEPAILDNQLSEISGGQKQRIAIASVLLLKRPILLMDEPTSALDQESTDRVADLILSLKNITLLSVSHDKRWIDRMERTINF